MHQNGTLVARHPPAEASLGKRLPLFDEMMRTNGPMREREPGGRHRALRRAQAGAGLSARRDRDARCRRRCSRRGARQSIGTALRTLALSALAVALLVLLMRQLKRLDITQERYALAVAGSDDGVWEYDFVKKRVYASARAREISGLPSGPRGAIDRRVVRRLATASRGRAAAARRDGRSPGRQDAGVRRRVPHALSRRRVPLDPHPRPVPARRRGQAHPHGRLDQRHRRPQARRGSAAHQRGAVPRDLQRRRGRVRAARRQRQGDRRQSRVPARSAATRARKCWRASAGSSPCPR